jgi:hypothetical protein
MVVKREWYLLHAHYPLIESAERQLSNKCTGEHGEEVSDIVGHDCQHTAQRISLCGWIEITIWGLTEDSQHLQQPSSKPLVEDPC